MYSRRVWPLSSSTKRTRALPVAEPIGLLPEPGSFNECGGSRPGAAAWAGEGPWILPTAGGRAQRAGAGAGQLQRVRRVEVGQAGLGGEARTDHADTYGDVGAVLVLTLALQCVAAGDDRRQRCRIEQGVVHLLRRGR